MNVNTLSLISVLILLTKSGSSGTLNIELVFKLQTFFKSDLILIVKKDENDELIRKIYKFKNLLPKVFIGTIHLKDFSQKSLHSSFKNVMVLADSGKKLTEKLVQIQDYRSSLMASAIWINFIDESIEETIEDLSIPYNAKYFLIKKMDAFSYEIVDVYQIAENFPKSYSVFAVYRERELQVFSDLQLSRMDLKGHQFNIALSLFEPELQKKYGKYWELFSTAMNFSLKTDYYQTGKIYQNNTKTGLFKLIEEHKVDGSPCNYVYNHERKNVFDYIFPAIISETRMYLKLETRLNWTSYISPFRKEIWMSIIMWSIVSSCAMHIIIQYHRRRCKELEDIDNGVLNVLKGLCNQSGMKFQTRSVPLCISYLMPYLLAMVLTQYYSGSLLSHITVKKFEEPFQTFHDAIKDGTYKILVLNNGYHLYYIMTDNGEDAKAVRNGLLVENDKLPDDSLDGFHQLCKNRWVFLHDADNLIIKEDCLIVELNEIVFLESLGMIVWKSFPYKDILTKLMRRLQFSGIVKLKEMNTIVHNEEDFDSFKPLSMALVFPIFLFLFSVIILCGLILLAEMKWKNLWEIKHTL